MFFLIFKNSLLLRCFFYIKVTFTHILKLPKSGSFLAGSVHHREVNCIIMADIKELLFNTLANSLTMLVLWSTAYMHSLSAAGKIKSSEIQSIWQKMNYNATSSLASSLVSPLRGLWRQILWRQMSENICKALKNINVRECWTFFHLGSHFFVYPCNNLLHPTVSWIGTDSGLLFVHTSLLQ